MSYWLDGFTIVLSKRDFMMFSDAIENPPLPNEKLKELFEKHKDAWKELAEK